MTNRTCFLCMLLLALSCSKKTDEDRILASARDHHISVAAFSRSYIQQIVYSSVQMKDTPEARKKHVQDMLLRHDLAQKAVQAGLDTLAGFRVAMKAESTAVIIHGLYEHEIASELDEIPDQDVATAFTRMSRQLHVRHLAAKTKPDIDALYRQLNQGQTFHELARSCFHDSVLARNGGDLGFITWGDMDLVFENQAYALAMGEISKPVETKFGWHIIKLENVVLNPIVREDEYQAYKEIIRAKIRNRMLTNAADFRIKELMTGKEVIMNVPLIRQLETERKQLKTAQWPRQSTTELPSRPFTSLLEKYGRETLATYKGGVWTVDDFARHIVTLPRGTLDDGLYGAVAMTLRNYFLLQIAERKNIDEIESVRNTIREKREHLLANIYGNVVADTVTFTEADYRSFYDQHKETFFQDRRMRVLEILLPGEQEAVSLLKEILASGKDETVFRRLAKTHTRRPGMKSREGFLGIIGRQEYGAIGHSCFKMRPGDVMGPIKTDSGYSVVMLLDYTDMQVPFSEARNEVNKAMQQQKRQVVYEKLRTSFLTTTPIQCDDSMLIDDIYMSSRNKLR